MPEVRADHRCCLSGLGSVNTPICKIMRSKEQAMSKRSMLGDDSRDGECAGRSIVEMMEDVLDGLFRYLMQTDMETADPVDAAAVKGEAQGVARCIAIIRNPYYPNVNGVKAEAVDRYEEWLEDQPDVLVEVED